jgi:hypothetical protein
MPAGTMADQDPEPTDPERLLLHLIDVGAAKGEDGLVCPICRHHEWDILGPAIAIDPVNSRPGVQVGRPMLQVVCSTCFYMQHFLWEPIRRKQFSSEALARTIHALQRWPGIPASSLVSARL